MKNERIHFIHIARFPISLGQFLKLAGVADSGAAAKALLASGGVLVNGEAARERGKKLRAGDTVTAGGVFRLKEEGGNSGPERLTAPAPVPPFGSP